MLEIEILFLMEGEELGIAWVYIGARPRGCYMLQLDIFLIKKSPFYVRHIIAHN
jgi:hypothetical protein